MAAFHAFRSSPATSSIEAKTIPIGFLILLLCFLLQCFYFIRANSPTYDEAMHIAAGYSYLATGDFRLEPQNPPLVKEWLALPIYLVYRLPFTPDPQDWREVAAYFIGQSFLYDSVISADRMLLLARSANVLLGLCLVGLVGWWSYRIWGTGAAILATALASFEPNLVAHSSLVTTDAGSSLFTLLTVYLLWEYLNIPTRHTLIGIGVSLGLALVCKFSAVLLVPIVALIVFLSLLFNRPERMLLFAQWKPTAWSVRLLDAAAVFFLILLCAASVIPTVYFFDGFEPWGAGLQRFLTLARVGQPGFFLEDHSYEGWWSYYLIAFLIKTPLGSLTLVALSLIFYRTGSRLHPREALCLLLPVVIILLVTTQAKVNIGLRHILPIYPFLFVLASRLATIRFERRWLAPALIGAALSFSVISSLRIAPHQLAYFNEAIGGPEEGHRYLADSNVDWGQDLKTLKAYMEREGLPIIYLSYFGTAPPSYYGIRYQYVPGSWPLEWPPPADKVSPTAARRILAVSVNNLQDVGYAHEPLFRWLRRREPVAKLGYSIFVYDLTEDPAGQTMLERTYAIAGLPSPSSPSVANP